MGISTGQAGQYNRIVRDLGPMRVHLFRSVGLLHLIAGVMYLFWRLTAGLTGFGSFLFWCAELFVWLAAVAFFLSRFLHQLSHLPVPEVFQQAFFQMPRVDVLVMRRWDSVEATRQTALAALRLNYPWDRLFVHVVDLAEDEAMAKVARAVPCEYWACPNPAVDPLAYVLQLGRVKGDYFLLLDPGQFPDPSLLFQALPLFYDSPERAPIANRTGFVQVMLRTLGQPRAVHPLQQVLAVGSRGYQAAPLLGSGCLIRRQALEGIPDLDSCKPVRLGCQLHRQGWVSHLVRETQVTGALLPLRNRRIALLALFSALKENPFWRGQTSQQQQFQYLWLTLWGAGGVAEIAYLAVPIAYLWTGWTPVPAFDGEFFAWFLPYVLLGRFSWFLAFPPSLWRAAWQSERQTGSQFFQSIQALVQSLQGVIPDPEKPSQLSLGPQALAILLTLLAIGVGSVRLLGSWDPAWAGFVLGLLWAVYNLLILTVRPDDHDFARLQFSRRRAATPPEEVADPVSSLTED
ncbi:glycosyltransferase family 2 protein [Synechococcus sp. Nb3U1]|uniref:glycosyltransferase family 2 protein n=1 Tax=Synechococcus sp. Nb3U1 TaxID=1914529 RepID=UPI001F3F5412|nr:glycosyltransferase family 2 protein [Synechococcus sp. Nb3U1]